MILNIINLLEQDSGEIEKETVLYILKKMELANIIYSQYDTESNKRINDEKLNDEQIEKLFIIICNWCKENNDIATLSTLLNFKNKRKLQGKIIEEKINEIKDIILNI